LEQALALLWRQGVSTVLWYGIADDPPGPAESATFEAGGLYYRDGRPKPAATAYRFPFVLSRASPSTVLIWVRAPASGRLVIERLTGHGWRESIGQPVRAGQILVRHVASATPATMRARVGRALSLPFTQR
ncbi:MAG: hypothetical protein KGJ43_07060, partial [Acidobacteriota bacterium]|nr:hypothetical protein [Acidobacteriota bacterium]